MSTIQDFYSLAAQSDFARLHQFRILEWRWNGSPVIDESTPGTGHSLYLETASLPNRSIANTTMPFMGLNFNIPGLASYDGSSAYAVSFRCDSQYFLRHTMEYLSRSIFNDADSMGDYNIASKNSYLTIGLLDKMLNPDINGDGTTIYTLVGANLVSIGTIDYNLGDTGTTAKVNATLSYHYWHPGEFNKALYNTKPRYDGRPH